MPSAQPAVASEMAGLDGNADPDPTHLPVELLHLMLPLARPSSSIARTCSAFHSICAKSHDVHIAWRNSLLLVATKGDDPDSVRDDGDARAPNQSTLSKLLISMLPRAPNQPTKLASAFAPTLPALPDPVFTPKFLQYLYTRAFASTESTTDSAYNWWRPDPHSLLLPVYLLRAGQLDLLELSLQLLVGAPWSAPLLASRGTWASAWTGLFLDDRECANYCASVVDAESHLDTHSMPYSYMLAAFALFEWSLPTLHRVMRVFPTLTRDTVRQLAVDDRALIFDAMIQQLRVQPLPETPEMVVDMYKWLDLRAIDPSLSYPLMIFLSRSGAPLDYMKRIIIGIDIANILATPVDNEALLLAQISKLLDSVVEHPCLPNKLLEIVLDRVPMGTREWAGWMPCNVEKCWELVQQQVPTVQEQRLIVTHGLHRSLLAIHRQRSNNYIPAIILNVRKLAKLLQVDFGVNLVDMMLENGGEVFFEDDHEPPYERAITLFACLAGTVELPEPAKLLAHVTTLLETTISPRFAQQSQLRMPCFIATMLFHMSMLQLADPLDCVRNLSPSQLAILTVATLFATSFANRILHHVLPLDQQLASIEWLVTYTNHALNAQLQSPSLPTTQPTRFFDRITLCLRVMLCDLVVSMFLIAPGTTKSLDQEDDYWVRYYPNPCYAKWVVKQVVSLDSQSAAAAAATATCEDEFNAVVPPDIRALIPETDQACAEMAYKMCKLILAGEAGEVVKPEGVSKESLLVMTRWMMEEEAYMADCKADEIGKLMDEWLEVLAKVVDQMDFE